jgi:Amt family ammonium transporter
MATDLHQPTWKKAAWYGVLGVLSLGVAALAGALVLGPRKGKYGPDGKPRAIPGHNIPMAIAGCFILLFGWFGFNAASTFAATDIQFATVAANTAIAAAVGATAAIFWVTWRTGKPDPGMMVNGMLAGLVGITAPCAFVDPWAAALIGLLAAIIVIEFAWWLDRRGVDDPVGAVSVHAVNGIWGTIAVGLFAQASFGEANGVAAVNGLFFGGGVAQLGKQLLGIVSVVAWVAVTAIVLFFALKKTLGIRVDDEGQKIGLDISEHNLEAYPDFQPAISEKGVI